MKFRNDQVRSIEAEVGSTFMGGGKIECSAPKEWKGLRVRIQLINGEE
jgi:hypothetical protein